MLIIFIHLPFFQDPVVYLLPNRRGSEKKEFLDFLQSNKTEWLDSDLIPRLFEIFEIMNDFSIIM